MSDYAWIGLVIASSCMAFVTGASLAAAAVRADLDEDLQWARLQRKIIRKKQRNLQQWEAMLRAEREQAERPRDLSGQLH